MPTVSRLRRWLAAVLIVILTASVLSPVEASTRATAELQHPRQRFLRSSTAGLFLHWTIAVNGTPVAKSFPGTGAWSLWRTAHLTVDLKAGTNVIRATATNSGGAPNLDYLEVATP